MRSSVAGLLACGIVAGIAIAGCGGGSDDGLLNEQEFVAQGNEICQGINEDTISAVAELPDNAPPNEIQGLLRENVLPIGVEGMHAIGDLAVEDEATARRAGQMVSATDKGAAQINGDDKALQRGSANEGNPLQPAADIATELKLTECFPALQPQDASGSALQVGP